MVILRAEVSLNLHKANMDRLASFSLGNFYWGWQHEQLNPPKHGYLTINPFLGGLLFFKQEEKLTLFNGVLSRNTHYCSSRWQDIIAQKALFRTGCLSPLYESPLTSLGQEMRPKEYCSCSLYLWRRLKVSPATLEIGCFPHWSHNYSLQPFLEAKR